MALTPCPAARAPIIQCDNNFERDFAKFLQNAPDVRAFAKLPREFKFTIE
jgi:restriction endonuclease